MAAEWLEALNASQREAVTFGDGPLLVIAGAGTGKTRTLACRVAYLIDQGVKPERILLLTFTRRAAAEMISRAQKLTGKAAAAGVWSGTFHAVGNRLLRMYGEALGLDPAFTILDQSDAADLMNLIRNEKGLATKDRRFPRKATLVKIYSHTVNAQRPLTEALDRYFPWCRDDRDAMADIFSEYTNRKSKQQLLDYDDLLLYWQTLMANAYEGVRIANRFEHLLVDEYQDTNAVQADILLAMRRKHKNIMVVGDDAQSIYSFRAATIRNILDFPEQFGEAKTVTLERNYRSTSPILIAANAVMSQAKERYTKELYTDRAATQKPVLVHCSDESQQTDQVCTHILQHLEDGTSLMDQAVLFRAGHHSADLEVELARRNIPYHKFGGLKFLEASHIKDMLSFLRILDNPLDELSWYRVLQLLQGIGSRTAHRVLGELVGGSEPETDGEARLWTPLTRLIQHPPKVPPSARGEFNALRQVFASCCGVGSGDSDNEAKTGGAAQEELQLPVNHAAAPALAVQIEQLTEFYLPILERTYENADARKRDLEQLAVIAQRYRSRSRFVNELTLDPPSSTADLAGAPFLEEDWLTLSTIHSAKGCEWAVVHILHAADGMIPSDMATRDEDGVDEERRLFYVAMTRAKDDLYVYFPMRYHFTKFRLGDGHTFVQLTRFLPQEVRLLFEERLADSESEDERAIDPAQGPSDLEETRARLNRLWSGGG